MTSHVIVQLTIHDIEKFKAYGKHAAKALAKYQGRPIQVSDETLQPVGETEIPGRVVIIEFPDRDAAQGWLNDPEFTEFHKLRNESAREVIWIL